MSILEKLNVNCHKNRSLLFLVAILLLALSSCTSSKYVSSDFSALAKAGIRLGLDIEEKDKTAILYALIEETNKFYILKEEGETNVIEAN